MDSFNFSRANELPQESFFAMLHQYLLQLGCSQLASMLVEEAKIHFNSDAAFNDAYLYEWWCLLWSIHSSLKSPPNMMPPPMAPNRFDPGQISQMGQDGPGPQTNPLPQNSQVPNAPQQQPQYGQMLMQTPGGAPQTAAKAKPKKNDRKTPKASSSATTPGALGSQAGLESLAIMVPGQAPLTVGRAQPAAKRHNLASVATQRPQLQPQQRAAVSQQQVRAPQNQGRNNRKPGQMPQHKSTVPLSQQPNQPSQPNQPNQPNQQVQSNQGLGMPMGENYMYNNGNLAPQLVASLGPNSAHDLKPNLEPNLTNFALQPPPLVPGMNGDGLEGQPDRLMDNDFGMNFLGADLNMDLNGFDMGMLK